MEDSITMNTSAVTISIIGVVSSLFTCFMNIYLLKNNPKYDLKVRMKQNNSFRKKKEMVLFYYRFFLDVILGALVAAFLAFVILYSFFSETLSNYQSLIFYLSLPASNVGAIRSIVTLSVAIERIVMIFAFTFVFAVMLCIKLFILNKSKDGVIELSRVNRLALIDAATVCIFDFLPSFIANQFSNTQFFKFENIGPYGAVAKLFGCAIEACLVFQTLIRSKEQGTVEESKSIGRRGTMKMTEVRIA
ncbi:hypothetical protein CAEBREN_29793 [Caenorhabditis brenneri]|uniref:Uncharacterized protein n=1 Tax=Caenorhabditis brenneri TaxID=135651 RepID=G0PKN5_CAEBE|nr:hypothetical protein CAEBREN_29793 [Caenorhabditis brenneri]